MTWVHIRSKIYMSISGESHKLFESNQYTSFQIITIRIQQYGPYQRFGHWTLIGDFIPNHINTSDMSKVLGSVNRKKIFVVIIIFKEITAKHFSNWSEQ